jgi:hypothetical protein
MEKARQSVEGVLILGACCGSYQDYTRTGDRFGRDT